MDTFLIAGLEYLFNKSHISPYLVARLYVLIEFVIILNLNPNLKTLQYQIIVVLLSIAVIKLWRGSYIPERRNKKQYINNLKDDYRHFRTYLFIACLFSTTLLVTDQMIALSVFCGLWTWLIYSYLIALEWTKPSKNSINQRWPGARVLSRIKRKNYNGS